MTAAIRRNSALAKSQTPYNVRCEGNSVQYQHQGKHLWMGPTCAVTYQALTSLQSDELQGSSYSMYAFCHFQCISLIYGSTILYRPFYYF